jgi:hypothetical protein
MGCVDLVGMAGQGDQLWEVLAAFQLDLLCHLSFVIAANPKGNEDNVERTFVDQADSTRTGVGCHGHQGWIGHFQKQVKRVGGLGIAIDDKDA